LRGADFPKQLKTGKLFHEHSSVVFYVGKGAGQGDTGIHEITNPKG